MSIDAIGSIPVTVVADRGLSLERIFELNTRKGIASVILWRKSANRMTREDTDEIDRHGVPRCKHCGGPSRRVRFNHLPYPCIWFHCEMPLTDGCERDQRIACSNDWKRLLPVWRTQETYFALRETHGNFERVHRIWRDRYRVGAATHEMRPKRRGIDWQQLRANSALLVEWLRILSRHGWTGSARGNYCAAEKEDIGEKALERFMENRQALGLNGPYGPVAVAEGFGELRPQSRRRPRASS